MNNKILSKYNNGNTVVTIFEDGTKIREFEDGVKPFSDFPESIDIKLTNKCDLGCNFCHEKSNINGKHADLTQLINVLSDLPAGVELACGGGNALAHPMLGSFLHEAKQRGWICNLTVNQKHLERYHEQLDAYISNDLIKGLGISVTDSNMSEIEAKYGNNPNVVVHLIAGVHEHKIIDELIKYGFRKFLILGYKVFGNGVCYYNKNKSKIENNIKDWTMYLPLYFNKGTISFDNLAIEQLKVKRFFTDKFWQEFYMGDEFTHSMYIDAVNEEYAHNSRSSERIDWDEMSLFDYFKNR